MKACENPGWRLVFGLALGMSLAGCVSSSSAPVYVDVDQVIAAEQAPELKNTPPPRPKPPLAPVVVKQAGLPASRTTDRTLQRLETAKRLISENRSRSIAALSSMLKRIYLAQAEDQIAKNSKELQPGADSIIAAAYEKVRLALDSYGQERGPLLAQLNAWVGNIDLADQAIPDHADAVMKVNIPKANLVRAQIRSLDSKYNAEAAKILADAQAQIDSQIAALTLQANQTRATAQAKAQKEAESQATKTQTSLDVQVQQLVPESLPSEPAREVTVPGTRPMLQAPIDNEKPIFGSLAERRHLLDQQVDIWIRTTGHTRSTTPKGVRDATEDFLQWRSAHKVGP